MAANNIWYAQGIVTLQLRLCLRCRRFFFFLLVLLLVCIEMQHILAWWAMPSCLQIIVLQHDDGIYPRPFVAVLMNHHQP